MIAREIPQFFEGARDCLGSLAQDRAEMFAKEVPRFFEGVRGRLEILTQYRVEVEAHLARRFSFFHFIDFDENRISDVFAYLLDPNETHGQGSLFLGEFLKDVHVKWLPEGSWSRIRVGREVPTTRIENWRRIDIEIAFHIDDGWVAIAIENKPWDNSTDEPRQLSDYAGHLESMYEGHFKLIYLTPDGKKEPSEASITPEERKELEEKDKFAKASIQEWTDGWLKRAEDEVKAERVRWFVSDFRKALIESLPAEE
ncbi:MAG: PD-(D/E)XK nuclease family protein [Gemmatimonadota bacterium]|nr:PD-(D/E)XK nuclease family protein [Gemmatimonadota bacterium]